MKFFVIAIVVIGLGAGLLAYWSNEADPLGSSPPADEATQAQDGDETTPANESTKGEAGAATKPTQNPSGPKPYGSGYGSVRLEVSQYLVMMSSGSRVKQKQALKKLHELDDRYNEDLINVLLALNDEVNRLLQSYNATGLSVAEKESLRAELKQQAGLENHIVVLFGHRTGPKIVDALIHVSRNTPADSVAQASLLLSLASQGPSEKSRDYFLKLVEDPEASFYQKNGAIGYLAEHNRDSELPVLDELLNSTDDPRTYAAALVWASQLKPPEVVIELVDQHLGRNGHNRTSTERTLFALAEVATLEQFEQVVSNKTLNRWDVESARRAVQFRQAPAGEKEALLPTMLKSHYAVEHLNALKYLLQAGKTDIVTRLAMEEPHRGHETAHGRTVKPKYKRLGRLLGYRLTVNRNIVEIEKLDG